MASLPISINSGKYNFQSGTPSQGASKRADPMKGYQPLVKNLRNIALRNRNLLPSAKNKVKMPLLNCEPLYERCAGVTSAPHSP